MIKVSSEHRMLWFEPITLSGAAVAGNNTKRNVPMRMGQNTLCSGDATLLQVPGGLLGWVVEMEIFQYQQ